ncbi:MAG TPA: hypothetical protein VG367_17935 [Mucilaginibacter sp.]|jgi:hypothetical protein|nr:hypothetical protein [Mucilaginibacter sp.]
MTAVKDRSVLLLATNKQKYLRFALNCADSVRLHNPDLPVFIVTNIEPDDQPSRKDIKFLAVPDEIARLHYETKLYLNDFLQTEETLFIDSDCLCYSDLTPVFDACAGRDVTVIGRTLRLEDFWGDSAGFARETLGINKSIMFNGGFIYMRKTELAERIFLKAREVSENYDAYGFLRIQNNLKSEETLLQIAMATYDQLPIADDGRYMTDLFTDFRPKVLNVLKKERLLQNPASPSLRHRSWYPRNYSPAILHFGGSNIKSYPYISQSFLLKLRNIGVPTLLSSIVTNILIHTPYRSYHRLRSLIRGNKKDNG